MVLAAVVMITFMAHHPVASAGDTEHLISELNYHALASAIIHSMLIGTLGLLLLGFTGLADQLGWNRLSVRGGLIALSIGCVAMTAAALSDGFIIPAFAASYVDTSATDPAAFRSMSCVLFPALAASARLGVFSLSLAAVLWSVALVARANASLAIGAFGLIAGALPIILLLTGHLHIDFHGMLAFVVSQAAWYLAIGIQLIRRQIFATTSTRDR
jgi:hypothetical protein